MPLRSLTLMTAVLLPGLAAVTATLQSYQPDASGREDQNLQSRQAESDTLAEPGDPDDRADEGRLPTTKAIEQFRRRVETRPQDYLSLTILGQLYLRHAREEDHLPGYTTAEETLRAALEINPQHRPAMTQLALALQAQHKFDEALVLASAAAAASERDTLALATQGDCQLHLGRYEEAAATYKKLAGRTNSPAVMARLAHLSELQGQPDRAVTQITEAMDLARRLGTGGAELAWYEMRLGHLLMSQGQLAQSADHFRRALGLSRDYSAAQMGLAEVLGLQGQLQEAEQQYRVTINQHGEPPAMAGLGDVLTKLGRVEEAQEWYQKAEAAMAEEATTAAAAHYREVALFYANHNLRPERALELAELDLKQRQDVYAHDALAWALYRNQQFEKAHEAMQSALRLKTRDARMHFHAGMICLALGDLPNARAALMEVAEINPHFSILDSELAATELKKLQSLPVN